MTKAEPEATMIKKNSNLMMKAWPKLTTIKKNDECEEFLRDWEENPGLGLIYHGIGMGTISIQRWHQVLADKMMMFCRVIG